MELEYEVTREDYWAFNRYFVARLQPRALRIPRWALIATAAAMVVLGAAPTIVRILEGT